MTGFADNDQRHGTYAGAMAHNHYRTPKCAPCREAARLYIKDRRRTLTSYSRFTFPMTLGPLAYEMEGLGLTIARTFRESA